MDEKVCGETGLKRLISYVKQEVNILRNEMMNKLIGKQDVLPMNIEPSKTYAINVNGSAGSLSNTKQFGNKYKPIYFYNGVPVASDGTRGESTTPLYMSNGVLTACTPYESASVAHALTCDSATNATNATNAANATNDGVGQNIASTYQTQLPKNISKNGLRNIGYLSPQIVCVRDGVAVKSTVISDIVQDCVQTAYKQKDGYSYKIVNASSTSITITGFAQNKTWSLPAKTFMTAVCWDGEYYREDT